MAEKYRKIDPRIWKDEKFLILGERERLMVLYVLTAQSNRIGLFNFSPAMASEDLGVEYGAFLDGFKATCAMFSWEYDETLRVLYIPTWWKYNQPENANVLIGNLKDLHDIPNSYLLERFLTNTKYLKETLHETFLERIPKPSETSFPKQEQEQEQEQEKDNVGQACPTVPISTDPEKVDDLHPGELVPQRQERDQPPPAKPGDGQQQKPERIPYKEIVDYLNLKCGCGYKSDANETRGLIRARWNTGFRIPDFKLVIDAKYDEWAGDAKWCKYLRPQTLFGTKFEGYLQAAKKGGRNELGEVEAAMARIKNKGASK